MPKGEGRGGKRKGCSLAGPWNTGKKILSQSRLQTPDSESPESRLQTNFFKCTHGPVPVDSPNSSHHLRARAGPGKRGAGCRTPRPPPPLLQHPPGFAPRPPSRRMTRAPPWAGPTRRPWTPPGPLSEIDSPDRARPAHPHPTPVPLSGRPKAGGPRQLESSRGVAFCLRHGQRPRRPLFPLQPQRR